MKTKTLHAFSLIIGTAFLSSSVFLALFYSYSHFYTMFVFGSWLVLDWVDYRRNGNSILGYFYNHKHRDAFFLFFIIATIFAWVIDYAYGVRISGLWEWTEYRTIHFIRMYLVMNAAFILSMYELYRVIRSYLKPYFSQHHIAHFRIKSEVRSRFVGGALAVGLIFVLVPLYVLILRTDLFIEYFMLLPFIGMVLISDSVTAIYNGQTVIEEFLRIRPLRVASLLITVTVAAFTTEILNLFATEWHYLRMPFSQYHIFGIPIAVFFGWIPLVLGVITLVNMIKHLDYVRDQNK